MHYAFALVALAAAVTASPFPAPQAVTAVISPSAPAPSCCTAATTGSFGIVVSNITTATSTAHVKRQATQLPDGQPGVGTSQSFMVVAPVSQINDGQPQGALHTMTMMPVSQISDGQVQATYMPVSVISDGQPQAPVAPKPTSTTGAVSQISDGQPQASTSASKSVASAPAPSVASTSKVSTPASSAPASSAPASSAPASSVPASSAPASSVPASSAPASSAPASSAPASSAPASSAPASSAPASSAISVVSTPVSSGVSSACSTPASKMVACSSPDTLTLTLANGILKDAKQRTGYIASNFQFQFDNPPQSNAIYTSGFSICANGSLALGGSTTFYQCLSGNFYNLYNENWAAQCTPVTINYLSLQACS